MSCFVHVLFLGGRGGGLWLGKLADMFVLPAGGGGVGALGGSSTTTASAGAAVIQQAGSQPRAPFPTKRQLRPQR